MIIDRQEKTLVLLVQSTPPGRKLSLQFDCRIQYLHKNSGSCSTLPRNPELSSKILISRGPPSWRLSVCIAGCVLVTSTPLHPSSVSAPSPPSSPPGARTRGWRGPAPSQKEEVEEEGGREGGGGCPGRGSTPPPPARPGWPLPVVWSTVTVTASRP